jgi:F420-dependent oxidoreductase-like protein
MSPSRALSLGLHFSPWASTPPDRALHAVLEAERLGFDSVWTAEGYGNDALTPLAWWGSQTKRVRLGTAVAQISARPPSGAAMAALTLDHLCGGRVILGLGASGPQVVEGWYGAPFARPLERTREYVDIIRQVARREEPVTYQGKQYELPLSGGTGLGKPLRLSLRPVRSEIPIFIGAEGPKNIAQTAAIADGWLSVFYSPFDDAFYRRALDDGFARPDARRGPDDFEVVAIVPVVVDDDAARAADKLREYFALYFGGMGAKSHNFHADVARRMGYEAEVDRIQAAYLDGRRDEAAALVPQELIEKLALVGPPDKIRHDLEAWRDSAVTTLSVQWAQVDKLPLIAELVLG